MDPSQAYQYSSSRFASDQSHNQLDDLETARHQYMIGIKSESPTQYFGRPETASKAGHDEGFETEDDVVQLSDTRKEFPFIDTDGSRYRLFGRRPDDPLPPRHNIREVRITVPVMTEQRRRTLPKPTSEEQNEPHEILEGLESGMDFLDYCDSARPGVLVTRFSIVGYGRTSGTAFSQEHPPGDTPLPANLSLEEICEQYPNHVWSKMLRVFMSEGWVGNTIHEHLPQSAHQKSSIKRPHNYIQAAYGRQIDQMMAEDSYFRKIRQTKNKAHKRKVQSTSANDVSNVASRRRIKRARSTVKTRPRHTQQRLPSTPRLRLASSVSSQPAAPQKKGPHAATATTQAVSAITMGASDRQTGNVTPYALSIQEMNLQQEVSFLSAYTRFQLADQLLVQEPGTATMDARQRLVSAEPRWIQAFAEFRDGVNVGVRTPLGVVLGLPLLLGHDQDPLESMIAIVEHHENILYGHVDHPRARKAAYDSLIYFLFELRDSLSRWFSQQIIPGHIHQCFLSAEPHLTPAFRDGQPIVMTGFNNSPPQALHPVNSLQSNVPGGPPRFRIGTRSGQHSVRRVTPPSPTPTGPFIRQRMPQSQKMAEQNLFNGQGMTARPYQRIVQQNQNTTVASVDNLTSLHHDAWAPHHVFARPPQILHTREPDFQIHSLEPSITATRFAGGVKKQFPSPPEDNQQADQDKRSGSSFGHQTQNY